MLNSSPCYASPQENTEQSPKKSKSCWDIICQALEIFNQNSHYLSPTSPQATATWANQGLYSRPNLAIDKSEVKSEKAEFISLK